MAALQRANEVRLARVALKRDIKAGEVLASEVLLGDIPDWLEGMRLEELCGAIPRFGWRHFERSIHRTHTRFSATVADLTTRKREVVAEDLADYEADPRRARPPSRVKARAAA